ncbi:hypothetical protein Tco_0057342, partial [Tanacetum coccineum]
MILLVVNLPAGCFVSAGSTMILLVVNLPAGCFVSAAELVCAGSIMFLLADLFLLVVTCFCCLNLVSAVLSLILLAAQFDIAGFTRKLFANMKFKWEGQPIPLTPPMLAIAAASDDAANEENAAAHEAAGSTAEAHPEPHSPPVSPVREPTPERQPETEWVVPNPVSPVTDWRPWPSVPAHSPIRDPTPEPASPPTPPAQTFMVEEPLVFGPAHRPVGDVDPDVIESIIFCPPPRPHGYVDPDFVEPIIFGPRPRPDCHTPKLGLDGIRVRGRDFITIRSQSN